MPAEITLWPTQADSYLCGPKRSLSGCAMASPRGWKDTHVNIGQAGLEGGWKDSHVNGQAGRTRTSTAGKGWNIAKHES